jgi:hypothetical protein
MIILPTDWKDHHHHALATVFTHGDCLIHGTGWSDDAACEATEFAGVVVATLGEDLESNFVIRG